MGRHPALRLRKGPTRNGLLPSQVADPCQVLCHIGPHQPAFAQTRLFTDLLHAGSAYEYLYSPLCSQNGQKPEPMLPDAPAYIFQCIKHFKPKFSRASLCDSDHDEFGR